MLKHVTYFGSIAAGLLLCTQAFAQDVDASTVVATVGDTEITLGEVIIARSNLPEQYSQFPDDALFDGVIDQLVQQQLLADALESVPAGIEYTLANERRTLMAGEVITALVDERVTEADVVAAYEERFSDFDAAKEYKASHLLVETQEEAAAAKARIDDGAAFADVARDVSTGPTGPNGGDLGWFGAGAMVPEFEETIIALEVGGVSEPFETQFGWHVATLTDTRDQEKPTLDQTRRQIVGELQEAAITAYLDELTAAQTVVKPEPGAFDPSIINQVELLSE